MLSCRVKLINNLFLADTTVPYARAELFEKKMKAMGNRCDLMGYEGAGHGFFNYGKNENLYFIDTMNKLDDFLVSLKYLYPR
ncbi:MAG: dienelactone hydrolase family protein [Bacteroidales bacterium]|nr:dienelactone hydrolase family protein [Bacteroidales bacterium]MCF8390167.1 dienelactone hydrolase family protein [Bacteroidales bacterium]